MCTRLHAIGFPCEIDRRTAAFIAGAASSPRRRVTCAGGEYRIWRSPAGAEIWLHYPDRDQGRTRPATGVARGDSSPKTLDPIDDLAGLSVVHGGKSDVRMRLVRTISTATANPLDGAAIAMLGSRRPQDKPIPFTFELLGYGAERVGRPVDVRVQVTALAQRVWGYPTEAAYLAATPSRRLIGRGGVADVTPGDLPDVPLVYRPKPGSLWLATGDVVKSMRLINPVTQAPYYWINLATDRGTFDLIASPDAIEGDISDGHVVQALVSVTGRIIERLPT